MQGTRGVQEVKISVGETELRAITTHVACWRTGTADLHPDEREDVRDVGGRCVPEDQEGVTAQ